MDNTTRTFEVSPPPAHAYVLLLLLGGVLPLGLLAGMQFLHPPMPGMTLAGLAVIGVLTGLLLAMRRRSVRLQDGVLEVRAGPYRKRLACSELALAQARIVDLGERTELRPAVKTNGISMPGFNAGHFRLHKNLDKAFCLLTQRQRVLWLPLRDGKQHLLISLERPQALLDALRACAS